MVKLLEKRGTLPRGSAWKDAAEVAPGDQRTCPGCDELMTIAARLSVPGQPDTLVFQHELRCPAARQRERAQQRRRAIQNLVMQHLTPRNDFGGLPAPPQAPDGTSLLGLADYRKAYPKSAATTHAMALAILERWLRTVRDEKRVPRTGICLTGHVGVGKSTLLATFARECVRTYIEAGLATRNRCPVVWWREQQLWKTLTEGMDQKGWDDRTALHPLMVRPLVVFDNLGGQAPSPWWIDSILFPVIDQRNLDGLPVFATSKYSLDELQAEWSRSMSGGKSKCAPDLIDRLKQAVVWTPVTGGSHRKVSLDF